MNSHPATTRLRRTVPRLALNQCEAAEALGVSISHFERHIKPDLPVTYTGSLKLYPLAGIQQWLDRQSLHRGRRVA
jgi:hypothetical protein